MKTNHCIIMDDTSICSRPTKDCTHFRPYEDGCRYGIWMPDKSGYRHARCCHATAVGEAYIASRKIKDDTR